MQTEELQIQFLVRSIYCKPLITRLGEEEKK
jgi:hypothetical protein